MQDLVELNARLMEGGKYRDKSATHPPLDMNLKITQKRGGAGEGVWKSAANQTIFGENKT